MKYRTLLFASLLSLCLVGVASAQVSTVEGTVASNTGGILVIGTASGQRTFVVDAQSSVPSDLAVGSRVVVEYDTMSNDQFHVTKVTAGAPAATEPATTTAAPQPAPADTTTTAMAPPVAAPPPLQTAPAPAEPMTAPAARADTMTTTAPATVADNDTLPETASPLPLLALAGMLAIGAGLMVRRLHA